MTAEMTPPFPSLSKGGEREREREREPPLGHAPMVESTLNFSNKSLPVCVYQIPLSLSSFFLSGGICEKDRSVCVGGGVFLTMKVRTTACMQKGGTFLSLFSNMKEVF